MEDIASAIVGLIAEVKANITPECLDAPTQEHLASCLAYLELARSAAMLGAFCEARRLASTDPRSYLR